MIYSVTSQLQFKSIAAQRDIRFSVHDAQFWIDTDPQCIRLHHSELCQQCFNATQPSGQRGGRRTALTHDSGHIRMECAV